MKKADSMFNVGRVCRLFGVPISSFYKRQESKTICVEKALIVNKIKESHIENIGCYGRRRMQKPLRNEGIKIGIFKVARLMKDAGVIAKTPKKPHYYPSGNEKPISLIY